VSTVAVEAVVAQIAKYTIRLRAAAQRIAAVAARDGVVAEPTQHNIISIPSADPIRSMTRLDRVVSAAAVNGKGTFNGTVVNASCSAPSATTIRRIAPGENCPSKT
jgi:hypothetical protein